MGPIETNTLKKFRLTTVFIVSILTFSWLAWTHFHGGVQSHHILDQKDLPAISNWWSAILLPVLTWMLTGRIKKRIDKNSDTANQQPFNKTNVLSRFILGLFFGIMLSISFIHGYKLFLDNVLYVILVFSFAIPIYYSEFILGFILGMTYTFGAILPAAFISLVSAVGFVIYKYIRPIILKWTKSILSKSS